MSARRKIKPIEERFWAKVDKTSSPKGCWLWTGAKGNYGYGVIGAGRRGEGNKRAHVLSWEWANGRVPGGMVVCHRCDTPACVNPKHLFIDTPLGNIADMRAKGRAKSPPVRRGEDNNKAKLDFLDVALVRTLGDHGWPHRRIAAQLGVGKSTITRILAGTTWKHTLKEQDSHGASHCHC